jgi:hypothetical protein
MAPSWGEFLRARGHDVAAITTRGPREPAPCGFELHAVRRDRPRAVRMAAAALAIARAARGRDVVYAAGMYTRSALAARGEPPASFAAIELARSNARPRTNDSALAPQHLEHDRR